MEPIISVRASAPVEVVLEQLGGLHRWCSSRRKGEVHRGRLLEQVVARPGARARLARPVAWSRGKWWRAPPSFGWEVGCTGLQRVEFVPPKKKSKLEFEFGPPIGYLCLLVNLDWINESWRSSGIFCSLIEERGNGIFIFFFLFICLIFALFWYTRLVGYCLGCFNFCSWVDYLSKGGFSCICPILCLDLGLPICGIWL